jgi:hypothetical protein
MPGAILCALVTFTHLSLTTILIGTIAVLRAREVKTLLSHTANKGQNGARTQDLNCSAGLSGPRP